MMCAHCGTILTAGDRTIGTCGMCHKPVAGVRDRIVMAKLGPYVYRFVYARGCATAIISGISGVVYFTELCRQAGNGADVVWGE